MFRPFKYVVEFLQKIFNPPSKEEKDNPPISEWEAIINDINNRLDELEKVVKGLSLDSSEKAAPDNCDWFAINPNESKQQNKTANTFIPPPFSEIPTFRELKIKRQKEEQERLKALEAKAKDCLSKINHCILKEDISIARNLLQEVRSIIPQIRVSSIIGYYRETLAKLDELHKLLDDREQRRLAEERRKQAELERQKRIEEENRRRLEQEQKEQERLRQEKKRERLYQEAKQREQAEQAERQRLNSLCEYKKDNYQEFKEILESNGIHCFYHFTDKNNLQSIKHRGGLLSWSYCNKHDIKIPRQGGNETSRNLDKSYGLEDYVRLSFCSDHPMAWVRKQDGYDLVLLEIKIDVAWFKDTLFSDMNATDGQHIHGGSIDHLKSVRFFATKRKYVSRNDDDFKYHQAEVMVKTFIPLRYIININNPEEI